MLKSRGISFLRSYFQKHHKYYSTANTVLQKSGRDEENVGQQIVEPHKEIIDEIRSKILFNSLLEDVLHCDYGTRKNYFIQSKRKYEESVVERRKMKVNAIPLSLKYYTDDPNITEKINKLEEKVYESIEQSVAEKMLPKKRKPIFPYAIEEKISVDENWMSNYEAYKGDTEVHLRKVRDEDVLVKEEKDEEDDIEKIYESYSWRQKYGTSDPDAKPSDVQCGGCGAIIHCKDSSIPGYLPSEIFKNSSPSDLYSAGCQRCYFLKEYKLALGVNVRPQDYELMLQAIQPQKALVILMVDLLDFPCSIWPNILDIVGHTRPIVVVGNKVDLIPQSSPGFLKHMEAVLKQTIMESSLGKAQIHHTALISAKTGWGVEDLITKLYKIWSFKGDIYIVGTTNVGKSTLFNMLLQSDYCNVKNSDVIQRATVSPWPGTTLNLLKFPIYRPPGAVMFLRHKRLLDKMQAAKIEEKMRQYLIKRTGNVECATLIGSVERTLPNMRKFESKDPFSYNMAVGYKESGPKMGINDKSRRYINSRWCHDTPGVVHPEQIITLLTIDELMNTLPKELIRPRTFYLFANQTIFLGGIARLDVIKVERALRLNVFASNQLPITACNTEDADLIYSKLLGTEYFKVPIGDEERLKKWPGLQKSSQTIEMTGKGWRDSVGDIVLSSSGWISVNANNDESVEFAAWIVGGRGVHVRKTSFVDKACQLKGERIDGTPAYKVGHLFVDHGKLSHYM